MSLYEKIDAGIATDTASEVTDEVADESDWDDKDSDA